MKSPKQYCREYIELAYSDPDNPEIVEQLTESQELEISRAFYAGIECTFKVIEEIQSNGAAAPETKLRMVKRFHVLNARTAVDTTKAPEEGEGTLEV